MKTINCEHNHPDLIQISTDKITIILCPDCARLVYSEYITFLTDIFIAETISNFMNTENFHKFIKNTVEETIKKQIKIKL